MLLTKEVEVTLNGGLITHLKERGVKMPMHIGQKGTPVVDRGAKIMVKVEDLRKKSSYKVRVKCECCGKERDISARSYFKYGGKYCASCTHTLFMSGENNCNWKPTKTIEEREDDRSDSRYIEWTKQVMARDHYICQYCKNTDSGHLVSHHLDGYNWAIDKRYDITNGVCLCQNCHNYFHSIYGKGDNTKEQFIEFMGNREFTLTTYNREIPRAVWGYCIETKEIITDKDKRKNRKLKAAVNDCIFGNTYQTIDGKHYIRYDDYLNMTDADIFKYLIDRLKKANNNKYIVCLNNGLLFLGRKEANTYANSTGVTPCCAGRQKYAGYDTVTGEPLRWQFLYDWLEGKTLDDYYSILNNRYNKGGGAI